MSAFMMAAAALVAEPNAAEELGMTQATFSQGALAINYCERVFSYDVASPMRLVLVWHGGSGKGNDNLKQLTTYAVRPLLAYMETNRVNGIVIVPQCPSSAASWLSGGTLSPMMASRALVRSKAQTYKVASTNIFFAGISMGGTSAYTLFAQDTPSLFAKAVVCSGAGDTGLASAITTRVRVFNGADDTVIDPDSGKAMAHAITMSGGDASFTILPGYDHAGAAEAAFSAPQWEWFFTPNTATELGLSQSSFSKNGLAIDYCAKTFRFDTNAAMRAVLLWHGGSGRGTDNLAQLSTPSLRPLLGYLETNQINCVVLVPQCPSSATSWISGGQTSPMMATRALLRSVAAEERISADRTFFAGISMGGTASYSLMAQDTPNLFAKAVVCSGAGDTSKAVSITARVRIFNGSGDTIIAPSDGEAMANAINADGGNARYFLLPGYDHFTAAEVAFSNSQWNWFFQSQSGTVMSIH